MTDTTDPPLSPNYEDPRTAPFVYFDLAPTYGILAGAVQIELASRILLPTAGGVMVKFIATGRLRCSPAAAGHLRDAINESLRLLEQPQQGPGVASGRLS
jgi:hypothetical protein